MLIAGKLSRLGGVLDAWVIELSFLSSGISFVCYGIQVGLNAPKTSFVTENARELVECFSSVTDAHGFERVSLNLLQNMTITSAYAFSLNACLRCTG